MTKKKYEQPTVLVTTLQLGVFGQYGSPDRDGILEIPSLHRHSTS